MMSSVDDQPLSVPQMSVDNDATSRSQQMKEKSVNESSRRDDQCAQVLENCVYNLRPRCRNVDEATKLRREKWRRMREKRIQNKLLKKHELIRKNKEMMDMYHKSSAILDEKAAKFDAWWEEQRKLRLSNKNDGDYNGYFSADEEEMEGIYTSEVINGPANGSGEWVPLEPDDEYMETSFELKRMDWGVEKCILEVARYVVGLESFTGDNQLFTCSGTIVEFLNDLGYVVTTASLVRCPDKDEQADKLTINVWLASGEQLEGTVSNVDFYYNICVIKVPSIFHLTRKSFSQNTGLSGFYGCDSKDVVALGRSCMPWSLEVALGKLIPRGSRFDCEELLLSSCKISRRSVGGPVVDFDGNIIGMSFYDKKETPFLPCFVVMRCLQHFENFRKVIRPLHGLRVKNLHEALAIVFQEKINYGIPGVCGVIVEKVEPSAEHSEIKIGDVITHVDGVPFSNAAEMGALLLDRCSNHMLDRQKSNLSDDCISFEFRVRTLRGCVRTLRGCKSETTTRTINVDKFTPSGLNRWPFPRTIIFRLYADGVLYDEQFYTMEV